MKKLWEKIKSLFKNVSVKDVLDKGEDIAVDRTGDLLEKAFEGFYKKNPKAARGLVGSLHAFVPFLQEEAAKTSTDLDDKGVAELLEEIQEFYARHSNDEGQVSASGIEDPDEEPPVPFTEAP